MLLRSNRRVWTYQGERDYYDPVLYQLLREARRENRNLAEIAHFKASVSIFT